MPPSKDEPHEFADKHLQRLLENIERDQWPPRPDRVDPLDSTRVSSEGEPSPEPPQIPRVGAVVHDSWELNQILGKGAFGLVFGARHRQLERDDAVKFLHPHLADDRDLRSRFLREAKIMARVHGEHLVHVHDCGEHEGLPFFVMERLQGETLQDRLRRDGPLPIASVRSLAVGILRGLGEVHSQGIIHRDMKPANMFVLEGSDRIKLLDFGLAMTSLRMTAAGTTLGTPLYMAPELLESPDTRASVATDIYSAGAVIYQMLTGHAPFEPGEGGGKLDDFVRRIGATDLKSPRQTRPEVPEAIAQLVLRMLDRDPDARPTKAGALADELDRVFGAPPSKPSAVIETRSRGISRGVVGAMSAVLLILCFAVGYTWPWGAAPTLTDSDGILVTAPWWASTEVEESFEAACQALMTRAPRRVACTRASSWTMEHSGFREWALASGASIVVRFDTTGEAEIVLGEELDGVPLLAELPRLRPNELERIADLTSLLTVLPWSIGGAHFDVPMLDVETVGYRWATVAALLHRLHGEDPEVVSAEHLQELVRCDGARPDVLEDERLCDVARYLALTADPSNVMCGGRLQPELEALTNSESMFVSSSSQVRVAKCMVSEQPEQTAALVLGALDAIPLPHGCETLAAFELEPSLVGGSEAEQRLLGRIAAVDPRQCNALVAAHAIGKRAYARLESERVVEAAQDYYLAYGLDPGNKLHLVNWADTLLLQPLDEASRKLLLAELRLDLMSHAETDEDHQLAFAIALFRWLVDQETATAEEVLRRYDRMPTEVQPLMTGLGNGLHHVLHVDPSERNRTVLEEWLRLRPD